MNNIREYLCREARRITDLSVRDLPATAEEWYAQRTERWQRYMEMMGVVQVPPKDQRTPLNVRVTGTLERPGYRVEKLYFEALPRLYVTANLYVPSDLDRPAPAVVYVCGHSLTQKIHYQAHPRRFAQLGFVAIVLDTIEYYEMCGTHHGTYAHGQFQWSSRGYTPAGVEMWNAMRAVDLLQDRPEVNGDAIGVTGISGGGGVAWWLGAADERVKVVAPVCGTGTTASHIRDRTLDGHCDCMFQVNTYLWDLADVGALVAPRPLLVASANRDGLYSIEAVRECFHKVKAVYELLGVPENIQLVETPGQHSYHEISRRAIFSWFLKHLMGKEVSPEEVADIDERDEVQEAEASLLVFPDRRLPPDERTTVIHDTFVPRAEPPVIENGSDLVERRQELVKQLRAKTFRHFPEQLCDLDVSVSLRWQSETEEMARLHFTPEDGWRLSAHLIVHKDRPSGPRPVLLYLLGGANEDERHVMPMVERIPEGFREMPPEWARLVVAVRGVDETAWGDDLAWHVRRASALLGRTVASMRVLDALRAVEMAKSLSEVDCDHVVICGQGEMAVVAMYTALLDGNIAGVVLADPPTSQDMPGNADGTGPAIEMLNVLRFTDLPYVAGLLWPAMLVFLEPSEGTRRATPRPATYTWAEELYAKLGEPGVVRHLKSLAALRV